MDSRILVFQASPMVSGLPSASGPLLILFCTHFVVKAAMPYMLMDGEGLSSSKTTVESDLLVLFCLMASIDNTIVYFSPAMFQVDGVSNVIHLWHSLNLILLPKSPH